MTLGFPLASLIQIIQNAMMIGMPNRTRINNF